MRREFSAKTKRETLARSNGICECHLILHAMPSDFVPCGLPLGAGNVFYEHIDPDAAGGDNGPANCAALTKTCWKIKTNKYDKPIVKRVKKRRDRNFGIKRGHKWPKRKVQWWTK